MNIKVIKNGWEVVNSGYFVVNQDESVEFIIDGLQFRLLFETNIENPAPTVNAKKQTDVKGNTYMAIICTNFEKGLLRSIAEPFVLAKINGRSLALQLSVSSISVNENKDEKSNKAISKVVFYAWCISKEATERHSG